MTTIAYKSGVLACDKQASDNGTVAKAACKMVRRRDYVYAVAGTLADGLRFIDYLENDPEAEAPELSKTTVVRMSRTTGHVDVFEECDYPVPVEDVMYAWGSGADLAIGAMAHGATPREAVLIASKWDSGSGLGVQVAEAKRREK